MFETQGGTQNRTRDLQKKGSAFITSSDHWTIIVPQERDVWQTQQTFRCRVLYGHPRSRPGMPRSPSESAGEPGCFALPPGGCCVRSLTASRHALGSPLPHHPLLCRKQPFLFRRHSARGIGLSLPHSPLPLGPDSCRRLHCVCTRPLQELCRVQCAVGRPFGLIALCLTQVWDTAAALETSSCSARDLV